MSHERFSGESKLRDLFNIIRGEVKQPPTIGLIGLSGVGKSSTINALFGTNLATSATVACTKEFEASDIAIPGDDPGSQLLLRVVDAPGLGEDVQADPDYLEMYRRHLPGCDVILWVMSARNRAIALDQQYLSRLRAFLPRMVFAVSQVDLIDPLDWNGELNIPSQQQAAHLDAILQDRGARLSSVVGAPVRLVGYSAKYGFRLSQLFGTLLRACPRDRAWLFDKLRAYDPTVNIPAAVREEARRRGIRIG
jgi:predicted GTPase